MSGTSLDGVDAVLVDFSSGQPQTIATVWLPYSVALRNQALLLQSPGNNELHTAAVFANDLARLYACAVECILLKAAIAADQVIAIGCHGQTVRHQPSAGYSVQLNNPALLAELTKITVVADFRSRDIAAGGQGAPLVPAFHAEVFSSPTQHRVILNIGGFANLTDLNPVNPVRGFDCGPGNILIDAWISAIQGIQYDKGGHWASKGTISTALLERLMADKFFHAPPPKSCGRDSFNMPWLSQFLSGNERPEDVQATLVELTALTSAQAILRWCGFPDTVFVCGGGVHNTMLMARLQHHLAGCRVTSTDFLGQPPDWVEAVAFAWLAWLTTVRRPGNLPAVTGARGPRILGAIYPA